LSAVFIPGQAMAGMFIEKEMIMESHVYSCRKLKKG
jgi:hypothetical protein